jgi:hypothetical protein
MALSWFILRARYRVVHFIAVFVCLLGVGTMGGADIVAGREDNSGKCVAHHRRVLLTFSLLVLQRYGKR